MSAAPGSVFAFSMRPVRPDDAAALTAIAFEAKRHWGYPEPWIECWREALTIREPDLVGGLGWVAVEARSRGDVVGFAIVGRHADGEMWLDHLWVRPPWMGRGVGRALFDRAAESSRAHGAVRLKIEADPHAEGFYRRMSATRVGEIQAPMDGVARALPVLEKALGPESSRRGQPYSPTP